MESNEVGPISFREMGLDDRILKVRPSGHFGGARTSIVLLCRPLQNRNGKSQH